MNTPREATALLRTSRATLEREILAAVEKFQDETRLGVESIQLEHLHRVGVEGRAVCRVIVEVRI